MALTKQKYQKSELVNYFTFNNEQSNFITELELENNKLKKQLRLLNQDGLIVCDDIFVNKLAKQDSVYCSNAAHELIEVLKQNNIIDVTYIYKRTSKKYNVNLKLRKYIAIFNKK